MAHRGRTRPRSGPLVVLGIQSGDVQLAPGGEGAADVKRVGQPAEQVIRIIQGYEALAVLGRDEDAGGVVDAHHGIAGCVEDQERLPQSGEIVADALFGDVVEKALGDGETPARDRGIGLTALPDIGLLIG